jgi:hypothetical protein
MIAYALLVCLTLTGQAEDCRPFGNMRFRNKADCEHYRDHQAQRELGAQPRSDSNSGKKLVCAELNR